MNIRALNEGGTEGAQDIKKGEGEGEGEGEREKITVVPTSS